eukprot:COSAG01_NODE_26193_length_721_cov_1.181672_2_plen_134_part_01
MLSTTVFALTGKIYCDGEKICEPCQDGWALLLAKWHQLSTHTAHLRHGTQIFPVFAVFGVRGVTDQPDVVAALFKLVLANNSGPDQEHVHGRLRQHKYPKMTNVHYNIGRPVNIESLNIPEGHHANHPKYHPWA